MAEPTITCPQCKSEIKLTESLAAPLLEATRLDFQKQLTKKDADIAKKEEQFRAKEEALTKAKESIDEEIAERLEKERAKIAAEAEKKAKQSLGNDLKKKVDEVEELKELIEERDEKLAKAQKAEAQLLKMQRELADKQRELELTIEKGIQDGIDAAREQAQRLADESWTLKLADSQKTIRDMEKQINDLKRKAEQGSQQLQGEVMELELEERLTAQFPTDTVAPVPKGQFGGDVIHSVRGPLGQTCGTILWESKRTKTWSDGWLQKLKDDQRAAKAEIAIIVSEKLPKDVTTFHLVDGIWVTHWTYAIPVAVCIRQSLIELATARQAREGQDDKMVMVYEYLTGPHFRQRVQAIVEAFSTMQEDLAKERRAIQAQWAKREKQLERVLISTAGMYGDLQGIASLKEIAGFDLPALEGSSD